MSIPIALPGNEGSVNNEEGKDIVTKAKILPSKIDFYHPGAAWGTFIYMTNGHALCSTWTVEELEEGMKNYWREIAKAQVKGSRIVTLPGTGGSKHHN